MEAIIDDINTIESGFTTSVESLAIADKIVSIKAWLCNRIISIASEKTITISSITYTIDETAGAVTDDTNTYSIDENNQFTIGTATYTISDGYVYNGFNKYEISGDEVDLGVAQRLSWVSNLSTAGVEFDGVTLEIAEDIDLGSKLWTPIGSGKDNEEADYTKSNTTLGTTPFKGYITGNVGDVASHTIYNMAVFSSDSNAGLFGYVEYGNSSTPFAQNIALEGGFVISINSPEGINNSGAYADAGALVGRLRANVDAGTLLAKVVIKDMSIVATHNASGIIGTVEQVSASNLSIDYSYTKDLTINGAGTLGGIAGSSSKLSGITLSVGNGNVYANEVYTKDRYNTNNATGVIIYPIANNLNGSPAAYYEEMDGETEVANAVRQTQVQMLNELWDNFSWISTWFRDNEGIINDGYPELYLYDNMDYWYTIINTKIDAGWDGSDGLDYALNGNTYTIYTGTGLAYMSYLSVTENEDFEGKTVILANDIYLSGKNWTPIGTTTTPFKGTFDGNYKTIYGLLCYNVYIGSDESKEDASYLGLFGYVEDSTIKNFNICSETTSETSEENYAQVRGTEYIASIAGKAERSTISNISSYGAVDEKTDVEPTTVLQYIGGIIGYAYNTNIINCTNNGNVNSNASGSSRSIYTGGIVGYMKYDSTDTYFCPGGPLSAEQMEDVIGSLNSAGLINTSSVYGKQYVGGIVGYAISDTFSLTGNYAGISYSNSKFFPSITDSHNVNLDGEDNKICAATPSGQESWVGGIAGRAQAFDFENVYNEQKITGLKYVGGLIGAFIGHGNSTNIGARGGVLDNSTLVEDGSVTARAANAGEIAGYDDVGGVVGHCRYGVIMGVTNKGQIVSYPTNTDGDFGGIVGCLDRGNLYEVANLTAINVTSGRVGGIASSATFDSYTKAYNLYDSSTTWSSSTSLVKDQLIASYSGTSNKVTSAVYGYGSHASRVTNTNGSVMSKANADDSAIFTSSSVWNSSAELKYARVVEILPNDIKDTVTAATADDLYALAYITNMRYGDSIIDNVTLTSNVSLDLSAASYVMNLESGKVGTQYSNNLFGSSLSYPFMGTFNGNSKTITLTQTTTSTGNYTGLFGCIGSGGSVYALNVTASSNITGGSYVGIIAGYVNNAGIIRDLKVSSTYNILSASYNSYVGGMFGYINGSTIKLNTTTSASVAAVNVTGYIYSTTGRYIGGVAGNIKDSTIYGYGSTVYGATSRNATIKSSLYSGAGFMGGVTGNLDNSTIYNLSTTSDSNLGGTIGGALYNHSNTGGIVGNLTSGTIQYCFNMASVKGIGNSSAHAGVGGIAGTSNGNISYCYNSGRIESTSTGTAGYVGGIIGYSLRTVSNCTNSGEIVSSLNYSGGIIGYGNNTSLNISSCTNSGSVSSLGSYVGGIAGYINGTVSISSCTNSAAITGGNYTAGIVGTSSSTVTLGSSYTTRNTNSGNIDGTEYVGGIAGRILKGTIDSASNTGVITGNGSYIGGILGRSGNPDSSSDAVTLISPTSTGNVSGTFSIGGIVGSAYYTSVLFNNVSSASLTTGTISGSGDYVGGIIGYAEYLTINGLTSSSAKAVVTTTVYSTGGQYVGGAIGVMKYSSLSNVIVLGSIGNSFKR